MLRLHATRYVCVLVITSLVLFILPAIFATSLIGNGAHVKRGSLFHSGKCFNKQQKALGRVFVGRSATPSSFLILRLLQVLDQISDFP